jgi:hypothetical protein
MHIDQSLLLPALALCLAAILGVVAILRDKDVCLDLEHRETRVRLGWSAPERPE